MKQIQVTAVFDIRPGQLEAFRSAAAACLKTVREKDKGTSQYDWFFDKDRTRCIVRETYEDSKAVLAHVANLGDNLPAILETGSLALEIYGTPTPELEKVLAGLPHEVFSYFQGL